MARGKREWMASAQSLYVTGNRTLEEISERTGVSTRTLSKWKQQYDWDKKKQEYQVTASGVEEKIRRITYKLVNRLDEDNITPAEVDRLVKLVASLEKIQKIYDLRRAVTEVLDKFVDFLKEHYPEKLAEWFPVLQEFTDYVDEIA